MKIEEDEYNVCTITLKQGEFSFLCRAVRDASIYYNEACPECIPEDNLYTKKLDDFLNDIRYFKLNKEYKKMSGNLHLTAYKGKDTDEFKKHFKAVEFCIKNDLSFPKETNEFFKGCCGGDDLEDIDRSGRLIDNMNRNIRMIDYIKNGVSIEMKYTDSECKDRVEFNVKDIPHGVDKIVVRMSY